MTAFNTNLSFSSYLLRVTFALKALNVMYFGKMSEEESIRLKMFYQLQNAKSAFLKAQEYVYNSFRHYTVF